MPALGDRSPETIRRLRSASTSGSIDAKLELLGGRHRSASRPARQSADTGRSPARHRRRSAAEDRQLGGDLVALAACASKSSSQLPRRSDFRISPITSGEIASGATVASWAKAALAARLTAIRLAPARKKRRVVFISNPDDFSRSVLGEGSGGKLYRLALTIHQP